MVNAQSSRMLPFFFPRDILAVCKRPSQGRSFFSHGPFPAQAAAILAARLAAGAITTLSLFLLLSHAISRFEI